MITKKSEDAVSPVIGIMLLVVVTVIIAAVITAFATGVVGSTEPAPVAALDVEILNSENTLSDLNGPELFITHRSGDAVDTKDIELRFSWVCGVDNCESGGVHYSTYSADGFVKEHPNGIDSNMGERYQALYVKSTMTAERNEYKSTGINHYFGDVILTPGLKLSASSELLPGNTNTGSSFMDTIFNNYKITAVTTGSTEVKNVANPYPDMHYEGGPYNKDSYDEDCPYCTNPDKYAGNGVNQGCYGTNYEYNPESGVPRENYCIACECEMNTGDCGGEYGYCSVQQTIYNPTGCSGGIMDHLPAGTAVDVMIVHLPSDKAIFDKTVIVQ